MRKYLAVFLALIILMSLTACGSGKSSGSEVSPAPEAGTKADKEEQKSEGDQERRYLVETEFLTPDSVISIKCSSLGEEDCTEVSAVDYDWWFYATYASPEEAAEAYKAYKEYLESSFKDLTDSKGNTVILPEHDDTTKWLEFGITLSK